MLMYLNGFFFTENPSQALSQKRWESSALVSSACVGRGSFFHLSLLCQEVFPIRPGAGRTQPLCTSFSRASSEDFPQAAQVLRSQLDILWRQLGSGAVPEQSCFADKSKQLKTWDSDWIEPQGQMCWMEPPSLRCARATWAMQADGIETYHVCSICTNLDQIQSIGLLRSASLLHNGLFQRPQWNFGMYFHGARPRLEKQSSACELTKRHMWCVCVWL